VLIVVYYLFPSYPLTLKSTRDMIEKVNITDSNVVELIRGKLPIATEVKNGLKPSRDMRQEKRVSMTSSILLFERKDTSSFSDGILFSVQSYGGGPVALYFLSIYRSEGVTAAPSYKLNLIGGVLGTENARPKFKLYNTDTGAFKVFLERRDYTPGVYAKLLSSYHPTIFEFILEAADESEVAAASYMEESKVGG
jgi:hypothetical protein